MKLFSAKLLILFGLLVTYSIFALAQENCSPILPASGMLLNLQLGMPVEEVSYKLGKDLKIKTKSNGDYRFFQNYVDKTPPNNLSGVRAFYLRFFEKKLYQIEVFYEESKYPSDLKKFAEIVSNQLKPPLPDWEFAHRQAVLKCGETSLKIDYQLNPRVELTDETILQKVAEQYKTAGDS